MGMARVNWANCIRPAMGGRKWIENGIDEFWSSMA